MAKKFLLATAVQGEAGTAEITDDSIQAKDLEGGFQGSVNTTDATPAACGSFTTSAGEVIWAEARVQASDAVGAKSVYHIFGSFKNVAGTLSQVGSTIVLHQEESDAAFDCDFAISGQDIQVQVTGKAATNLAWTSWCRADTRAFYA